VVKLVLHSFDFFPDFCCCCGCWSSSLQEIAALVVLAVVVGIFLFLVRGDHHLVSRYTSVLIRAGELVLFRGCEGVQ
jgi:hypothetical protein